MSVALAGLVLATCAASAPARTSTSLTTHGFAGAITVVVPLYPGGRQALTWGRHDQVATFLGCTRTGTGCVEVHVGVARRGVQAWYVRRLRDLGDHPGSPGHGPHQAFYHVSVPGDPDALFMFVFQTVSPHRTDVWASLSEWRPIPLGGAVAAPH